MATGPEFSFQRMLRLRITETGGRSEKTHGNQYSASFPDLVVEWKDNFRWVELKAVTPEQEWAPAFLIPVTGELREGQYNFLHARAQRGRGQEHVASLVVTEFRLDKRHAACICVLAGTPALTNRKFKIPWATITGLPVGACRMYGTEGFLVVSYEYGYGSLRPTYGMPTWPVYEPWWRWETFSDIPTWVFTQSSIMLCTPGGKT